MPTSGFADTVALFESTGSDDKLPSPISEYRIGRKGGLAEVEMRTRCTTRRTQVELVVSAGLIVVGSMISPVWLRQLLISQGSCKVAVTL